ncbi:propanediol/glycerol family dehydratase large subunit [Escherichia coli]
MGLPPITDEEVEAATYAHGSKDMPERNIVTFLSARRHQVRPGDYQ